MARTIPEDRFKSLIEVATATFIAEGYRQTQMADVAEALGVAKGTLYGYVQSKAALFDAAVRHADGHERLPETDELPVQTPAPGATVALLEHRIASEAADLRLVELAAGRPSNDPSDELHDLLADLYRRAYRN
ncbi:MAG: TetR/AcrR family transcriptional regulator, partial [Myxococcales bacterium]|nr:TetR/AcrR family transcriptional regulator [Deltaproteobacteria bacterium]NNL23775.1 TetR/AcrR family transcriptional regulator [Myxococcales bacterium]